MPLHSVSKQRILFVGPYPPPHAGPEMAMKTLLESPMRERFDISFLNTNFRKSSARRGMVDFLLIQAFFRFVWQLSCLLMTKRPRIVYYFVTATILGWLGRDIWCIFLSRLFGAKVVLHMRAGHFHGIYKDAHPLHQGVIKFACSLVSLGIVQGPSLQDQFQSLIADDKIVDVYNAIDTDKYCNPDALKYNHDLILFLGHLTFAKGYCDLLKVLPNIARLHPNLCFCFAGVKKIGNERNIRYNQITGERIVFEDPEDCYQRYIKGRWDNNYRYLGVVDEKKKIELLQECNFLILPSYSEGFSMAVLEALSMGKPVVCTPVGALGDIIKNREHGLLANPGDLKQLEKNILILLNDNKLRDRIALNNHAYVRQQFSVDTISQIIGDHFERTME